MRGAVVVRDTEDLSKCFEREMAEPNSFMQLQYRCPNACGSNTDDDDDDDDDDGDDDDDDDDGDDGDDGYDGVDGDDDDYDDDDMSCHVMSCHVMSCHVMYYGDLGFGRCRGWFGDVLETCW